MLAGMRLLATDLDGTLIFHHAVGQADAEALVRWRKAGNLLVLATGRSVQLVQHAAWTTTTRCAPRERPSSMRPVRCAAPACSAPTRCAP